MYPRVCGGIRPNKHRLPLSPIYPRMHGRSYRIGGRQFLDEIYSRVSGGGPCNVHLSGTLVGYTPQISGLPGRIVPVYSRVGGASAVKESMKDAPPGIPPRGRGKFRNIGLMALASPVYPRMCGASGTPTVTFGRRRGYTPACAGQATDRMEVEMTT